MVLQINTIKEVLKKRKSVLVLGPRGSGKTYFVNHLLESFIHTLKIDLLDGALYRRYLNKPEQLSKDIEYQLNNDVLYVFIDEVQTIPQLLNEVHRLIELYKERCVFILTGSSARKLKRNDTNLLAGRALFFPFYPFNSSEIDTEKHFSKILQFGTLPEVFLENEETRTGQVPNLPNFYLSSYSLSSLNRFIYSLIEKTKDSYYNTNMEINEKIGYWTELSDYDVETAEAMQKTKRFLYVGFMCHQVVEKILKALYVATQKSTPPYTHNLMSLAKDTSIFEVLSDDQKNFINLLRSLNVEARYPSYKEQLKRTLNEEKCHNILLQTKEFQQWIKRKL